MTAIGDLMLALNAHIRRDNPIRAVEQTEGVLRVAGADAGRIRQARPRTREHRAPELDGRAMLTRLARRYDPTIDDRPPLFGTVIDPNGLYSIIAAWREESWRNAEQLRHARAARRRRRAALSGQARQIEASAKAGADAILAATRTTPRATRSATGTALAGPRMPCMSDESIAGRIERLVAEEHDLQAREQADSNAAEALDSDRARLRAVEVELDRCWDLLRQRRALRSAGADPDDAHVRDAETVERYQQ